MDSPDPRADNDRAKRGQRPSLRDLALQYHAYGFTVLPIRPRDKKPIPKEWSALRLDRAGVEYWWTRRPDANIGLQCGAAGWVAVDCDGDEWAQWALDHFPSTPLRSVSGSGHGTHLIFRWRCGLEVKTVRNLPTGLTIRVGEHCGADFYGDGTQIILPGSIHPSGGLYRWMDREVGDPLPPIDSVPFFDLAWLPNPPAKARARVEDRPAPPRPAGSSGQRRGDYTTLDIVALFRSKGMFRAELSDGKHAVVCPWDADHSPGGGGARDSSTVVWEASGGAWPRFKCLHANHCDGRGIKDVIEFFGPETVAPFCARKWSPSNASAAASVPWPEAPPPDDLLSDGWTDMLPPPDEDPTLDEADRPRVVEVQDLNIAVQRALGVLRQAPEVYVRGPLLVRITHSAKPPPGILRERGVPIIAPLPPSQIAVLLCRHAVWIRLKKVRSGFEEVPGRPSTELLAAIVSMGLYPDFRPLEGIIRAPVLRADGSVVQTPGYDPATGLYYEPDARGVPQVRQDPTQSDAQQAVDRILQSVRDFPWKSNVSESAWLAGLLTIPARHAFAGPSPLVIIDANMPGTGKTKLAHIAGLIGSGAPPTLCVPPADDDEMRKRITAFAIQGEPVVNIDNVAGDLGWPSLDGLLTSPDQTWSDRVLGVSESVKLHFAASWWCTANNATVSQDTARRALWVTLETPHERPESRTDIEIQQPDYTLTHLPKLQADALCILMAYCAAGRPPQDLVRLGSFEGWSDLVRSAVVWLGLPDPAANRHELQESADVEFHSLRRLLSAWREIYGVGEPVSAADLVARVFGEDTEPGESPAAIVTMREAIEELLPGHVTGPPSAKSVGRLLRRFRGRVTSGLSIASVKDTTHQRLTWVLREADGGSQ